MIFILFIKNLYILFRNYILITNLIKKKDIFLMIFSIFLYICIFPNTAYCETIDTGTEEIVDKNIEKKKFDYITWWAEIVCFISTAILIYIFLEYIGGDLDDGYFSDSSDIPEVKPPHKPYTQGPGYHFFVRDMGIIYDSDLEIIPEVGLNIDDKK